MAVETFWISFRLAEDRSYSERYADFQTAIFDIAERQWAETTSFYILSSELNAGQIANRLRSAINTQIDLVVIGMFSYKTVRVLGQYDDRNIEALVPFMKKA